MIIAATLIVFSLIALTDIVPIYRKKVLREILVSSALFALTLALMLCYGFGVPLPSPIWAIERFMYAVMQVFPGIRVGV